MCCGRKKKVANLQNQGLISADRGTKATLTRTVPGSLFKSYTKDLSLPEFEVVSASSARPLLAEREPLQWYDLGLHEAVYTYS